MQKYENNKKTLKKQKKYPTHDKIPNYQNHEKH